MDNFSVRTTLTLQDWAAYMSVASARMSDARQDAPWYVRIVPAVSWAVITGVFVFMMFMNPPWLRGEGLALLVVSFATVIWMFSRIRLRASAPLPDGSFLGEIEMDFDASGFHSRRANSTAYNQWALVKEITDTPEHVFLWIDASAAYVLPARGLSAGMTAAAAAARIREFIAAAAVGRAIPVADLEKLPAGAPLPDMETSLPTSARPTVVQEFRALLRLHTWRTVDATRLYGRDLTIGLLGVLSALLWVGLDRLDYGSDAEFSWFSIYENGFLVLCVLFAAWALSRQSRPRIEMRRALLLVLGFLPIFIAASALSAWLPLIGALVIWLFVALAAGAYLVAGMRSLTGGRQPLAVFSVLIVALGLSGLSDWYYLSPTNWYEPEPETELTAEAERNREQIVFEQSARINAAITSLAPRVPGETNFFFVGFAGFADQRVFSKEIELAAKQVGARYGTQRRSVLLVNDEHDVLKYPLATPPSLRHALNALSQHMNVDEDVLFLALSSHGSEGGAVSVSSDLGDWRDLEVDDLADMLRESGIRWRVIVVSACYSGAFVEPLEDDHTIILTAAAADRTSFGCSDDNDLTYFGEAFYRDALPGASDLRAAFETARVAIRDREAREGETPSQPQAYFGKAIEQKLAAIEDARTK